MQAFYYQAYIICSNFYHYISLRNEIKPYLMGRQVTNHSKS